MSMISWGRPTGHSSAPVRRRVWFDAHAPGPHKRQIFHTSNVCVRRLVYSPGNFLVVLEANRQVGMAPHELPMIPRTFMRSHSRDINSSIGSWMTAEALLDH